MSELFCIQHCGRIVCAVPPDVCPLCSETIIYEKIPPTVALINVFVDGHDMQGALAIMLKPTSGGWMPATQHKDDLHIGVSDATGGVVNYFQLGVKVDKFGWEKCIVVYEVPKIKSRIWQALWNSLLTGLITDGSWSASEYNETDHNCFDFILCFLMRFQNEMIKRCDEIRELTFLSDCADRNISKNIFVDSFVIEKVRSAAKQIGLERDVAKYGFATE